jgi:hypothetical protein
VGRDRKGTSRVPLGVCREACGNSHR